MFIELFFLSGHTRGVALMNKRMPLLYRAYFPAGEKAKPINCAVWGNTDGIELLMFFKCNQRLHGREDLRKNRCKTKPKSHYDAGHIKKEKAKQTTATLKSLFWMMSCVKMLDFRSFFSSRSNYRYLKDGIIIGAYIIISLQPFSSSSSRHSTRFPVLVLVLVLEISWSSWRV